MKIKNFSLIGIVLGLVVTLAACDVFLAGGAKIKTEQVWARPSMAARDGGTGIVSGVFMKVMNDGNTADRLIGGKTDVAEVVEIHETVMEGEIAKMQKLPNGLEIPAGGSVMLKPGSYHVMLINLKQDLKVGDKFKVELQFDKSSPIVVEAEVKDPTAMMP
jgi:periplasmic copper chaperone A